jgi:hypothetical protein
LAEHVTQSGIRQLAFQQQPDPIIWAVREDGTLLSLTYEIDQNVIAWARHTTDGTVESVAVTYGDAGEADEVWLIVNRNGTRRLERLDSGAFTKLEEGTTETMVYLDAAKIVTQSASTAVSGLSHLNGEAVAILADGAVQAGKTVSAGAITLDQAASTVVVGIPYVSKLQPSKVEIDLPDGTAQGRKHTVPRATLNLWKTYGVEYADASDSTESKWFPAQGKSTNTPLGEPEPLYTGTLDINNLSSHKASVDLTIRQTLPLPANILAIVPKIEVHGN